MRATRFRWLVVALIFFITVINYIDRSAIAYAIGAIARDLGFGHHDEALLNGFILAAFSLGYMFTTFLGGILADRHGARVTLFWAALLWSAAIGMTGFAVGFAMLVVARVLLGVAEGPNFPAMNRAVADWLSSRERAIALGNALVAVPLALAIGAPIVTQLILHLSWRGMFIVLMLASLLWLPLWWWLFRDFPEHSTHVNAAELAHIRDGAAPEPDHAASARHAARRKTRGLWKFLLRNPTLLANDWAFFVFGYFLFFFMTWLPSYLQHAYGLKLAAVGWFSVLPWLTAALMLWGTGYLSDWLLRRTGRLRVARSHMIWVTQLLAGLCILPVIFMHDLGVALVFITLALKGGSYVYYFQYYLDTTAQARFLEAIGFNAVISGLNSLLIGVGLVGFQWPEDAATSAFSLFNAGGIVCMIIGIGFSRRLADRYGKRNVFGAALFVSTLFLLVFVAFPPDAIALVFASHILHGFFYGITIPLLWAMIADVADYSEWRNGRRATGIIFSAMLCGLKVGLSVGGALVAAILATYGYEAGAAVQSEQTVDGIRLAVSVLASTPFLICVCLLYFYKIDKTLESRIERELVEQRTARESLAQGAA